MSLEMLLAQFDGLIQTPADVAQLNETILDWAVRGKLVLQDPADEPASELLKRIAAEKARLVQEGKIRAEKPLPPVREEEVPYELPTGWQWTRLGEILLDNHGGKTPSKQNRRYWNGSVAWASVKDLNCDIYLVDTIDKITELALRETRAPLVPKGNIIVCTRMGLGKMVINLIDVAINQDLRALYFPSQIEQKYFYYFYQTLNLIGTGMTVKGIRKDELLNILVPLPPIQMQKRIVAKVEELFAQTERLAAQLAAAEEARRRLHTAAAQRLTAPTREKDGARAAWELLAEQFDALYTAPETIEALKQAILQLAVQGRLVRQDPHDEPASELLKRIAAEKARLVEEGKIRAEKPLPPVREEEMPYEVPAGWVWVRLSEIAFVGTGATPLRANPRYWEGGTIAWVTSSATGEPYISKASEFVTEAALAETNLQAYPENTLLVAMYGQGKTRGQVSELLIKATVNQACAAILFDGMAAGLRNYIKLFLSKSYDDLRNLAAGGAQPNLNLGKIKSTCISLPPLAEQKRIVEKVELLFAFSNRLADQVTGIEQARERLLVALLAAAR